MSDDEQSSNSGSESGGNDVETTGLIATRAKRSTAGNLYASLRNQLDDEEIRKELLADDEDDVGDYEGSEKDDDDDALDSSSDEEDGGPQDGEAEDLQGEKDLKKTERAEQRKKRKVQDGRLKPPAWQKKKKVKLADDVKTENGAPTRPKKKSERSNWLPTDADAPKRQSARSLAVQSREVTHANLKQSYERSEKQRKVMKNAAEREKTKTRRELTPQQRLEMCAKIAKQTDKEFGRWEREEEERQRTRDAALAAKRRRDVDGPYVRHWSGSAIWRGDKMEEKRVSHGSIRIEEIEDKPEKASPPLATSPEAHPQAPVSGNAKALPAPPSIPPPPASATGLVPIAAASSSSSLQAPPSWLTGILDYASQPPASSVGQQASVAPGVNSAVYTAADNAFAALHAQHPASASQGTSITYHPPTHTYVGWPPGAQHFPVQLPAPPPVLREQAQRSLIRLEHLDSLDINSNKRMPKSTTSGITPTEVSSVLLPDSYPPFTADELRYLLTKHATKKRVGAENMPSAPDKPRCAIIPNKDAKYRDPKTGLPYLDMQCYKIIQRVLGGGCQWSGLLGAWVGPNATMGRPARGVPEGFAAPPPALPVKKVEDVSEG